MRLKDFFIMDPQEKVTDRKLTRVLIASVCCILLTMAALVQTTWALFSSQLNNSGNVIVVRNPVVQYAVSRAESSLSPESDGSFVLEPTTDDSLYTITLTTQATQGYVILTMTLTANGSVKQYYCDLADNPTLTLQVSQNCTVSFATSWVQPDGATKLTESPIAI